MKNPVELPTPEGTTAQQVDVILSIIATLRPYVQPVEGLDYVETKPQLDGGSKSSAESVFIRACDRLESILSGEDRWTTKSVQDLYKSVIDTNAAQVRFTEAQTAAVKQLSRPSNQFKPSVVATADGHFVAFIGDLHTPSGYIAGVGITPAAAMADFDAAFDRPADEHLQVQQETQSQPPSAKPTRKKKQ